jgi:dCMP deaminase
MKWDLRFVALAEHIAGWSKDPSTKVGCVIVRPNKTIASLGYNGFPRGVSDNDALYQCREIKYARIVHAEANAMISAVEPLDGYSMYSSLPPCKACSLLIIQSGITRIVARGPSLDQAERWGADIRDARSICEEAGVFYEVLPC